MTKMTMHSGQIARPTTAKNTPTPGLGLDDQARKEIASGLTDLLADNYRLYLKTHAYHFNVTGPHFTTLHQLFEEQYRDLWTAFDDIAERVLTLGHKVPVGQDTFLERSTIEGEREGDQNLDHATMIQNLVNGHEAVAETIRRVWKTAAKHDDEGTVDLLAGRLATHEKTAWMLRAHLG